MIGAPDAYRMEHNVGPYSEQHMHRSGTKGTRSPLEASRRAGRTISWVSITELAEAIAALNL
jgi:hypothetical protein